MRNSAIEMLIRRLELTLKGSAGQKWFVGVELKKGLGDVALLEEASNRTSPLLRWPGWRGEAPTQSLLTTQRRRRSPLYPGPSVCGTWWYFIFPYILW